mgnify:CR=1 FL=1
MTYPQAQNEPGPEPQPETQLEARPHRPQWHQDPVARTWLFPPAVGAALGVLFSLGAFIVSFVQSFIDYKADVPSLTALPLAVFAYGYLGIHVGLVVSAFIQFCKLPQAQRHKILRALWKGVCVLTLLFAVLMSFGLLGGLLGSQLNRKL